MKRRDFVKYGVGSILTAPFIQHGFAGLYTDNYASPIVSVLDGQATSIDYRAGKVLNSDGVIVDKILSFDMDYMRVARMVDTAVMKITNQTSVGKAWESLFPAGHPNEHTKIGIKHNFSYGDRRNDVENNWSKTYCPFGPKSAVTNAIITGLSQMLDGTFPVENITLFEKMYSIGFRKNYTMVQGYRPVSPDDQKLTIDERAGSPRIHWVNGRSDLEFPPGTPTFVAAPDYPDAYSAPQRIYSEIYRNDFLINYAIAKDHREAGITGMMKNNYGCTDNPYGTHGRMWKAKDSPYAGSRRCAPVFYKNIDMQAPFILNMLDALTGIYHGGPLSGKVFNPNIFAVSKDPVAIDTYMLNMLNRERAANNLEIMGTEPGWTQDGHPNASVVRFAAEELELGSMSQDNLQMVNLSSADGSVEIPTLQKSQSRIGEVKRTKSGFEVEVFLDQSRRNHQIESRIEDIKGNEIRTLKSQSTRSSSAVLKWDRRNDKNESTEDGMYTWYINVDGLLHSGTINDYLI